MFSCLRSAVMMFSLLMFIVIFAALATARPQRNSNDQDTSLYIPYVLNFHLFITLLMFTRN